MRLMQSLSEQIKNQDKITFLKTNLIVNVPTNTNNKKIVPNQRSPLAVNN